MSLIKFTRRFYMMKKILMALVAAGLSVSLQAQNGAPA